MPLLHRRIAPALVVAQLLCLALMEFAFTFLSPGNPEPAATGSLGPDTVIARVAVLVSGCVAAGCVLGPAAAPPAQRTPHGRPTARTTG